MKRTNLLIAAVLFAVLTAMSACKTAQPPAEAQEELTGELQQIDATVGDIKQRTEEEIVQRGDLYVMAIGINEYSTDVFTNLKYAANDAQNICDIFNAQAGKVFRNVNTLLITDKEKITPTKENILKNMEFFKNARQIDTAVLFVASHRIVIDGVFYLMSSDSKYNKDDGFILSSFIKFDDILKQLNFKGNKILIIDTNSPEIAKGGDFTIIRACKENEQAIESSTYNGGLLTASILDAFANIDTEYGVITVNALFDYVVEKVGELSKNKQTPVLNAAAGAKDLIIGYRLEGLITDMKDLAGRKSN